MKDKNIHEKKAPDLDQTWWVKPARPGAWQNLTLWMKKKLGMNVFLCKNCRWDWRSACHNRERPNATWCADYQKKG
jgi:hypothetical protein